MWGFVAWHGRGGNTRAPRPPGAAAQRTNYVDVRHILFHRAGTGAAHAASITATVHGSRKGSGGSATRRYTSARVMMSCQSTPPLGGKPGLQALRPPPLVTVPSRTRQAFGRTHRRCCRHVLASTRLPSRRCDTRRRVLRIATASVSKRDQSRARTPAQSLLRLLQRTTLHARAYPRRNAALCNTGAPPQRRFRTSSAATQRDQQAQVRLRGAGACDTMRRPCHPTPRRRVVRPTDNTLPAPRQPVVARGSAERCRRAMHSAFGVAGCRE